MVVNESLAASLGMADVPADLLTGNLIPDGAKPVAMGYAGHQFGHYSPRLGDGRALLVGELLTADGRLLDLHLKGTGRTPFARGGDGLASIGPMLREHLVAEAMHALGVPTNRSLGVALTGRPVQRRVAEPGAVLARVAASHLRVGTFEYAARTGDMALVRRLLDHAIERHHPAAADDDQPALAFFAAVAEAQAELVARWMLLGFIHGVMNTDNTFVSGETLDYGPCAFMDAYDPGTVFSSIDRAGRYAYGNQPGIAQWNLARLAETLVALVDADRDQAIEDLTAILRSFPDRYEHHLQAGLRRKLGLGEDADPMLLSGFIDAMTTARLDWTGTFRALSADLAGQPHWLGEAVVAGLTDWLADWRPAVGSPVAAAERMDAANPVVVPRNHLVDEALRAAEDGRMTLFHDLLAAVTDPFTAPADARYERPASEAFTREFRTFCGT